MMDLGTSSWIAYHHLHPWLQGNVAHFDIDFDLSTEASHKNFLDRHSYMLEMLESGEFQR
jgi:hypothetical protein